MDLIVACDLITKLLLMTLWCIDLTVMISQPDWKMGNRITKNLHHTLTLIFRARFSQYCCIY
jgi:hypothetical protein